MDKATQQGKKATKEIQASFETMGDKLSGALSGALGQFGQFGQALGEVASTAMEAFEGIGEKSVSAIAASVTALGALGAAGIAAAAGLTELAKSGAEIVEKFSLVSQKTGIGIRDLQIFAAAGSTVGVSLDDMVVATKKFSQAITGFGKGAAAQTVLRELGVSSKDTKEALLEVADAFAKMPDGAQKASDAAALFGKSGLNLIPILNKGREGILEWEGAVDNFGPKIGKEAVEANEKYRASVETLSLQWDKLKVDLEQSVLPVISKMAKSFNDGGGLKAVIAGLAGGAGAAAILKDQLAAQKALTDEAKKTSAATDETNRKNEAVAASFQRSFEIQKAGGTAAFALEQARQTITDDIGAGLFKEASAIQSQLPGLEKAAALESFRAEEAKRTLASYQAMVASFAKGAPKPLLPIPKTDPTKGIEALFGPQTKNPLEGAPDLGQADFMKSMEKLPELAKSTFGTGKDALDDFYNQWDKRQAGTEQSVTDDFAKQLAGWQDLLNKQAISQQQFNDIKFKLEVDEQAKLKELRKDNGTSTFKDAWTDTFAQLEASGRDFARSITSDIGDAIQSLNEQLTKFVTTGKGLNIKQLGQQLEGNLASSLLKKGESSLFGSLGGLLGLDGTKPDGSTQQAALWVQMASPLGGAPGLGALPLGGANLGNIASLLPGGGSLLPSAGGGLSSLFGGSGFLSALTGFLPFLADGGDVTPGRAYVVGEKRPELFVPRSAGTVIPNVPSGGNVTHISQTFHISTPDADSFKKSQGQISSAMGAAASRGQMRNGR